MHYSEKSNLNNTDYHKVLVCNS